MNLTDTHLTAEYEHSALITIDVQNDTLDGSPFEIPGTSAILPRIHRLCQAFRRAGRPIVHVIRIYTPDGLDADRCRRTSLLAGNQIVLKGSAGRRPADALLPDPSIRIDDNLLMGGGIQIIGSDEAIIFKPRWGAFYRTPLETHLKEKGVSTLVVTGCNFPNCTRATIYAASERDFRICAVEDAISEFTPPDAAWLEKIGVSSVTTEWVCRHIHQPILPPMKTYGEKNS